MADIHDRESLEKWLRDRPRGDAVLIAARAALRVLPLVHRALSKYAEERRAAILLPTFRATVVASFAGTWPEQARGVAAYSVADPADTAQTDAAVHGAALAAQAAALVAAAPADAAVYSSALAADAAAAAAQGAALAAAAAAEVWVAISRDAASLRDGVGHVAVAGLPLWHDRDDCPEWATTAWLALTARLEAAELVEEGWRVWVDWYQAHLDGRPPNLNLDRAIALIDDDAWDAGPAFANAEVAWHMAEHTQNIMTTSDPRDAADDMTESKSRRLSLADFQYDGVMNTMEMVPFPEDIGILGSASLRRRIEEALSVLRDACTDLAREIQLEKKQVPNSLRRDLTRVAREANLGEQTIRPGRLRMLGARLVRASGDDNILYGLGDYLSPQLGEVVRLYLRLEATFHAGMLERMAPLAEATLEVTPEEADVEIGAAVDLIQSEEWRDLPVPSAEATEMIEEQREALRQMLADVELVTDAERRARMIRAVEEGHITLAATMLRFFVRTLEVVGERATGTRSATAGAVTIVGVIGSLASIIGLRTFL